MLIKIIHKFIFFFLVPIYLYYKFFMKKYKLKIIFIIVFSFIFLNISFLFPSNIQSYDNDIFSCYKIVKRNYKKVNYDLFKNIYYRSISKKLNPLLICSLINAESNWNKNAVSCVNARGLMQVMEFHYKGNPKDLHRIDLNFQKGFNILKFCKVKSKNDLFETLRRYNQGPNGNRKKYKNWKYVIKIMLHYTIMKIGVKNETI